MLLLKIPIISTDLLFDFKRLQFPMCLALAITINKTQEKSLSVYGLKLQDFCFSHDQFYVVCSKVGMLKNIYNHTPIKKNLKYCLSSSNKIKKLINFY